MLEMPPTFVLSTLIVGSAFLLVFAAELWRPLRRRVEPLLIHVTRNLATGGLSLAVMSLLQAPLLSPVASWSESRRIGILHQFELSEALRLILAVLLLDYTLWWWHWMNHRLPFFWRFHLVHHLDRDLDASTALRFHFGELVLSLGYRALQIVIIGASPYAVWMWQSILFVSILFHHSNWRLPMRLERFLVAAIVTPRMHGIHHSEIRNEMNSNWSSILSAWDYLHGTILLSVPQEKLTIGVPGYRSPQEVSIGRILALPFVRQKEGWTDETQARAHEESSVRVLQP